MSKQLFQRKESDIQKEILNYLQLRENKPESQRALVVG